MSIIKRGGTIKEVKNLGWLTSNWHQVSDFSAIRGSGAHPNAYLVAHLRDGGSYETNWASFSHMLSWLQRPIFVGLLITVFSQDGKRHSAVIGDAGYTIWMKAPQTVWK